MLMHFIMSFHLLCIHDTYYVHMHVIGSPEGVTLLEFEAGNLEEKQEVQPQEGQGEGKQNLEALPECPDHQPSAFMKGKPPEHSKPPMFL
jgi:hypothetical protein